MIKNYSKYIKEEIDNSDFLKIKKTQKVFDYDLKLFEDKDLNILNEEFTGFVKIEPDLNYYIMDVKNWECSDRYLSFNYNGYFSDAGGFAKSTGHYCLESKTGKITKYNMREPLIIKDERDPYGEEDWYEYMVDSYHDDEYVVPVLRKDRFLRFSDFIRFDLLSLRRLNVLREFCQDQVVVIKKGDKITRGRLYGIKSYKDDNGRQHYIVKMMSKKGEKDVEIEVNDTFKVKSPEKIKSNIDPYNEEDWEIFGEKPVSDSSRINKLLDKGANNLTEEERKELKELSRKTKLKKYKQVTYHTGKDDPVKKYFPKKLQPSIKPL